MRTDFPDRWIMVDQLKPVDLSNIRDSGMQGIAMLAVALDWNLVQHPGRPAQLRSREGITRNLPTDTSVRQSVFWSLLANILSHSEGRLPTGELIDLIVKKTGMSKAHGASLRSKVAVLAEHNPRTLDLIEPEEEEEAPSAVALEPEFVPTERIEPTLSQATKNTFYVSPLMDTVIRQLVANGDEQITYRCKLCGLEFETKRGVGGHYQVHVKAGEAEATNLHQKEYVKQHREPAPPVVHVIPPHPDRAPEPEPAFEQGHITRNASLAELSRLRQVVDRIAELVGREHIEQLQERCQELTIEHDAAVTRAERLASDLRTLRELVTGIADG